MLQGMALHPCSGCGRHVRIDIRRCAFCGADAASPSAAPSLGRVARMAAIGAAAVSLGACAETPKNTVEIHSDPSATSTVTTAAAPDAAAAPTTTATNVNDPDGLGQPGGPGWHRHGGGQCGPNGQCPPYGGAPPFDNFV
jgi:hypothetical protein